MFISGYLFTSSFRTLLNSPTQSCGPISCLQYLPAIKPEKVDVITEGFLNKSANHGRHIACGQFCCSSLEDADIDSVNKTFVPKLRSGEEAV